jgi:hypothetical protein
MIFKDKKNPGSDSHGGIYHYLQPEWPIHVALST